jgi:polysaccharide biosynthesis protein PslG
MGRVGNMWHRSGSVVGLGAAVATVLALVVQSGGVAAGSVAQQDGRAAGRALTAPRGTTVTNRFFGMHAPLLGDEYPQAPVGALDLTTNNVYWPQLETSDGVWDFTRLDAMVAQARQHGATPLLVLGLTPSFHIDPFADQHGAASVPDMTAWQNYVKNVATHLATQYPGPFDYQIWPEPNVRNNFTGSPQEMAALVVAAAKIIHNVAPGATVVAPAMVLRLKSERDFMKEFFDPLKNGGLQLGKYVDAVGVDPYPLQAGTPEDALKLVTSAQRALANDGVTAPMWNLEINYFVPVGGVTPASPPTDRIAMSYVIRTYVLNAAANVQRVYWLGWLKYFNLGISMVGDDGVTPAAPALAYSRVRTWLIGQHARGCTYDKGSGVYACRFVRAGRSSWVYWVQSGAARVTAPAGVRRVQTMYGDVSRTRRGDRIRVTNAPVRVYH